MRYDCFHAYVHINMLTNQNHYNGVIVVIYVVENSIFLPGKNNVLGINK